MGSVYASWCCPLHDNIVQVYGTEGALIAQRTIGPYEDGILTVYRRDREPEVVRLDYVSHYELQFRHFVECIHTTTPSQIVSGQVSLEAERARFLAYSDAG